MVEKQELLRRREAADRLGVHEDTVQRWARENVCGLKEVKIGRLVYIDVTNFNATAKEVEAK